MKKLVIFLFLFYFNLPLFSQSVNFGLKMGTNYGKLKINEWGSPSGQITHNTSTSKFGFDFGAFARLESRRFYLQPEVTYSVKNSDNFIFQKFADDLGIGGKIKPKLESFQVPLLLGYKVVNLPSSSIRIFTGPAVNFKLNNSWVNESIYNIEEYNFKNKIWDWQAGASLDVGKVTFDLRYEWGISNACDSRKDFSVDSRFQTLTFTIGVKML